MDITTYVLVNADDQYLDTVFETFPEARDAAQASTEPVAVVALHYVFDDSDLVWTADGALTWPPDSRHPDNRPSRRFTSHDNDLGDWCPFSMCSAHSYAADDTQCPQGCAASAVEDA